MQHTLVASGLSPKEVYLMMVRAATDFEGIGEIRQRYNTYRSRNQESFEELFVNDKFVIKEGTGIYDYYWSEELWEDVGDLSQVIRELTVDNER